jgi:hypothetical protein
MNRIIEDLVRKGFCLYVKYNKDEDRFEYELDGFYKSGSVTFYEDKNGQLESISRYDKVNSIDSFDDIVNLNYQWWLYSKDRFNGWTSPDSNWLPYLLEAGLIKEEVTTTKKYI